MAKIEITVPSGKLKTIIALAKKTGRASVWRKPSVYVRPDGLYTVKDCNIAVVPVPLPFEGEGFEFHCEYADGLLKAQGGVVFQTNGRKRKESTVTITYKDRSGAENRLSIPCRLNVHPEIERLKTPEKTIESSKFLSAVAACSACRDKKAESPDAKYALSRLCIEAGSVAATDCKILMAAEYLDTENLDCDPAAAGEKWRDQGRFLLDHSVIPLLLKSGTCRLGTYVENYGTVKKPEQRTVLYIGFPDYGIFTPNADKRFPDWGRVISNAEQSDGTIKIARSDALACLEKLAEFPRRPKPNRNDVYVCFDKDRRLCVQSYLENAPCTCLRFSEKTTVTPPGAELSPFVLDSDSLKTGLKLALKAEQDPITAAYDGFLTETANPRSLMFKACGVTCVMTAYFAYGYDRVIARVIELQDV